MFPGATASLTPNTFNETQTRVKRQAFRGVGRALAESCARCRESDDTYELVYEEHKQFEGEDPEEEVSNPITCGSVQCTVTVTNTVSRTDTYTKGYRAGWNTGLNWKISEAISVSLGHSGDVSWSWSDARTESAAIARTCPGRPGQRVTLTFKPRYKVTEGILHKRVRKSCGRNCDVSDKPSENYKIKSYGKRNGYLAGEENCRTQGGESTSDDGIRRSNNCRGSAQWGAVYDQWCSTNCAMNNCPSVYCTCS